MRCGKEVTDPTGQSDTGCLMLDGAFDVLQFIVLVLLPTTGHHAHPACFKLFLVNTSIVCQAQP